MINSIFLDKLHLVKKVFNLREATIKFFLSRKTKTIIMQTAASWERETAELKPRKTERRNGRKQLKIMPKSPPNKSFSTTGALGSIRFQLRIPAAKKIKMNSSQIII